MREEMPPGRDAAFRRTILEVYDYRCAACGIRVLLNHAMSLVEAAHLIPFPDRNEPPVTERHIVEPTEHPVPFRRRHRPGQNHHDPRQMQFFVEEGDWNTKGDEVGFGSTSSRSFYGSQPDR